MKLWAQIACILAMCAFGFWLLSIYGCATIHDYHAESKRIATCDVTTPNQIEAIDDRTGFPLLSTAHRYSCNVTYDGRIAWHVENESDASLETFADVPSAVIKRITPTVPVQ